jgi:endonuclease G
VKSAALLLVLLSALHAQPGRFSLPACDSGQRQLVRHTYFLVCYDFTYRVPLWTAYQLLPSQLHGSARRPSHFHQDTGLASPGARDSDYRLSGFSRGHMVPAEDLAFCDAAIRESFLLSNTAPQKQSLNAGRWRQLENAVREIAARSESVIVFTGPIFDSSQIEHIGSGEIAVPTHFFKTILAIGAGTKLLYAAIVPNADQVNGALNQYAATVNEVELLTGLDFYSALEDAEEEHLESDRRPFR